MSMWIQRTPDEIALWQKRAEGEASSHGRLIAGISWLLVSIFGACGWTFLYSGGTGIVMQKEISGSFWMRLALFGLITAPFFYWIFRYERRKELAKIKLRTVCPQCDTPASGNAGTACKCGGSFVLTSTMKWVEK